MKFRKNALVLVTLLFLGLFSFASFVPLKAQGWALTQLTTSGGDDSGCAISADGSKIAFVSTRDGDQEIFVINSDGTGEKKLTSNTQSDIQPSISGDGGKIAYAWLSSLPDWDIRSINSDGTGLTVVTWYTVDDWQPSISGDGSKIAYASYRGGNWEICVINSDGTGDTVLTTSTAKDDEPSISGDGSKIAFVSNRDGDQEIFVINSDGTGETQLTFNTASDIDPSISYDGSKIAFTSYRDGDAEIFVINSDGTGETQLTFNTEPDENPSLSGNGQMVAFNSIRAGHFADEIFVINSDGTGETQLTFNMASDIDPSISGDGSKIAFSSNVTGNMDIWLAERDRGLEWYQKPPAIDYAQSGVPDFDQKQDNWNSTGTVYYDLQVMAGFGWGVWYGLPTSPGPTLFATQGDTVYLWLQSLDGLQHDFFVDYDGNGAPSPGEPQSPTFTSYIEWSFLVNAPGPFVGPMPFMYACSMPGHNVTEWGTIFISPQRWSWCGPTAVANSLWWWDSHIDGGTNPPPDIEDHFPLVQNYGPWDDHDPQNVIPFVEDLARLMNTDVGQCGTDVFAMQEGVRLYLEEKGLSNSFYERTWWDCNLTFENLLDELYKCEDIILLLGVYQQLDPYDPYTTVRVGGHYVTVAGMGINQTIPENPEKWIKFSDPLIDTAEWMGLNYWPYVPITHPSHFGDSSVHNNASLVSHDPYKTAPTPDYLYWSNPDVGHFIIENYPWDILLFEGGLADNGPMWGLGPVLELPTWTAVEYAVIFSPMQYDKPEYIDYAPSKMPDFDQRQDAWTNPQTGKWSYCGPVAVANSLWWMDSKFEPGPAPPTYSDVFPLVQNYGPWDDHDPRNVEPFIQHLAILMKTDVGKNGTNVLDMQAGIRAYLEEKGLNETFYERTWHCNFTFADIEHEVEQCEDVILLLGRYEWQEPPGEWVRINGHYVTVSGVNANGTIKFSDPTLDAAEAGLAPGEVLPPGHGHPLGFMQHNDTLYVSHDYYTVIQGSPIIGTHWGIEGYPWYELTNFQPQGYVEPEQGITQMYFTAVEYAVIISPLKTPERDVAITNVIPSPTTVNQGDDVNVTITAANEGDYIETFTVTAYYDSNTIGSQSVGPLNPKASTTFNITWSTTGVPLATYTISANASTVPGETDTTDNSFTDGTVTVGVHDVAVTQVIRCVPKELLYPGNATILDIHANTWTVCINVTVKNVGDFTESFTVKAYYDNKVIGTKSVTSLAPGASITLDFKWTPSSALVHFDWVAKKYTSIYTIKAEAVLAGDANPGDNVKVDGKVRVVMTADVNMDGTISGGDLTGLGFYWGMKPGDPGYYAMADVNFDAVVSGGDLTGLGFYWGDTAPP